MEGNVAQKGDKRFFHQCEGRWNKHNCLLILLSFHFQRIWKEYVGNETGWRGKDLLVRNYSIHFHKSRYTEMFKFVDWLSFRRQNRWKIRAFGKDLAISNRKQILIFSLLSLVFNGVQYIFLSAWSGLAMVGVAIIRNIIFLVLFQWPSFFSCYSLMIMSP